MVTSQLMQGNQQLLYVLRFVIIASSLNWLADIAWIFEDLFDNRLYLLSISRVKRDEYSDHKWAPGYTVQ